jgi:AcrR family transcriptional regulator
VADVVRIARTSRRTFYEHFEDRADCFLALFEILGRASMDRVREAVGGDEPWEEQVDLAIRAYLELTSSEPELSRSYVDELASVGERGIAQARMGNELFARVLIDVVDDGRARGEDMEPLSLDAALFFVAGIRELVTRAIAAERDLMELAPLMGAMFKALVSPDGAGAASPARARAARSAP